MSHPISRPLSQAASLWLLCLGLPLLSACGGSGPSLSGQITFNGKPIENGSISLEPIKDTKGPTAGTSIAAGKYMVTSTSGLVPGTYRVKIRAAIPTGKKIAADSPAPPGTMIDETDDLPKQYNDESTLECTIAPGANQKNFELTTSSPN